MVHSLKSHNAGTFSVLATSTKPKLLGIAVASGSTFVADRVPHAKPGVGIIATQAFTNVSYGVKGLELLTRGMSPKQVLTKLLKEDNEKETRQVAIMDFNKNKAVFTGAKTPESRGEITNNNYVVIGNLLASRHVLDNMAEKFESSTGNLAWRLAETLKAGVKSGGDKRGEQSAALNVVSATKMEVSIGIATHAKPVEELFRKLETVKQRRKCRNLDFNP
jgi:uncharacterized Ntn-hydrolase superfamily protein